MQKKILSMLLVLVLLVTALPLTARAASSQWEWEGYTPISSYSELLAIGNNLSGKYYLTQDITASGTMSPIGSDSYPFTGILDGNGYTIRNLSISTYFYAPYAGRGVGLFARNSGIIRNLTLDNCTFDPTVNKSSNSTANYYGHLGLIAGYNTGEITNCVIGSGCTISPKIYASTVVGGITGYNAGTVKLCTNNAAITVYSKYNGNTEINSSGGITSSANFFYAGAIVGRGGTVYGCTNNGKLTCTGINDEEGIPGEVGGISSGSSPIAHCVNTGEIHVYTADYTYGTTVVGGIVGRAGGTVSDCESSGYIRVHGAMNYVGGIAGDTWDANLIRCARTGGNIRVDTKYYSDYGYGYIYFGGLVGNLVNSDITDSYTRAIYLYGYSDGYAYPRVIFGAGLVGTADGYSGSGGKNSTSSITNCYSLLDNFAYNTTQADSWCMAGLIGSSYGDVTTSYCYSPLWGKNSGSTFNMRAVYFSDGEGSFSYTRANPKGEMMNESFCVGFDFSNTWILGTGDYKYPVFRKAASHGHSLTPYSSIDHTCSSDGRIANWYCSGCQTYFRDSSAKFAISEDERTVMGGHSFTDKLSSSLARATTCVAPAKYYLQCDNCTYISNSLTASSGDPNPNGHSFSGGTCSYCGIRGGQCGDTLYWTLEGGKLTIYGQGRMYDYLHNDTAPWGTTANKNLVTSVEVLPGATYIGTYAFYNLHALTSVSFPEGLLGIGFRAFENADALTELTLPSTVKTIGSNTFHCCTSLESVNISQGVSSIPTGTFYGCSALKSVILPDGVITIGDSAFNGCSSLAEIYVPASVTSIGFKPFEGCAALKDHYYGGTAESYKSMVSITSANVHVHGNCESIDSHWAKTDFPATCTMAAYSCEICACDEGYQRNKTVTGPTLGHNWVALKFNWAEDFSTCTLDLKCDRENCEATDQQKCEVSSVTYTASNCKEKDYVTHTAAYQDFTDSQTVTGKDGPHSFTNYVSQNDATCKTDGTKIATCDYCEETDVQYDDGSMLSHNWVALKFNWAEDFSTCTLDLKCDRENCEATDQQECEVNSVTYTAANCKEKDYVTHTAAYQDFTDSQTVYGKDGPHSFTNYVSQNDATCKTDGTKIATCDYCEETDVQYDVGSMLRHNWVALKFNWAEDFSTCTLDLKCDRENCEATDQQKCEVSSVTYTASNCKEKDYVTHTAAYQDFTDSQTVYGKDGPHSFTNYVSQNDATCKTDGTKIATCDYCEETDVQYDVGSKLQHSWLDATCTAAKTCDKCGATEGQPLTHNFADGKCTVCGTDDPNYIPPATEPDPTEPDPTEPDPTEPENNRVVVRLAGDNRFKTAFLVAEQMKQVQGKPRFDAIVLASGTNFADALSGSYLAAVRNAPILLSFKGDYNYQTILYIHANLEYGGTVYILGGDKAVSPEFDAAFETLGIRFKRLAGADRFETNLLVLQEANVNPGDEILVCTGTDYADSLSGSATGLPILLVHKKLTGNQADYLATLKDNTFCIIGGEAAVKPEIEQALSAYGATERLAGSNRLLTSVMVAERYFDAPASAVVAYGWNFPDGLCGGPLAHAMKAPLILTHNKQKYYSIAASYTASRHIQQGYVLGGDGLVSNEAVVEIFSMGSRTPVTLR